MFPFELFSFGAGLMVAAAVLVVLFLIVLIKLSPSTKGEDILKKEVSTQRILKEETAGSVEGGEKEKTGVQYCPHYFGYLGAHPKNVPIPNECLTCIKIMECLSKVEES
jgi:hypothetical protein